jgi:hypothetical protein
MGELKAKVIENLLDDDTHKMLASSLLEQVRAGDCYYEDNYGRYIMGGEGNQLVMKAFDSLLPVAKEVFNSPTLLPSYCFFSHYEKVGDSMPNLLHHKDTNACTYTLDLCVYQTDPWDIIVEGDSFTLYPNQALAFYGEDQEHGRPMMVEPEGKNIALVFFHFVEPEHWFYSKGHDYVEVTQGRMTEEAWTLQNQK